MSFNDNAQLDTSQVQSGGSGGGGGGGGFPGGIQVGGGIGGLILLVLMLIFGGGKILGGGGDSGTGAGGLPSQQLESSQVAAAGQVDQGEFSQCKTGADANKNDVCLIIATVNSVQDYWGKTLPRYQMNYEPVKTVIYQGQTPSGCGTASSQRSTSSRTSTATTCRTSSASSTGRSRTPRAPTPAPSASSSWPTASPARGSSTRPRRPTPTAPLCSSPSPSRTSRPRSRPRQPSETTASRRRCRVASLPRTGRTARRRPARSGSCRATRPATSTSATPSASTPSADATRRRLVQLDAHGSATAQRGLEHVALRVGQVVELPHRQPRQGPQGSGVEDLAHERAVPTDDQSMRYAVRSRRR